MILSAAAVLALGACAAPGPKSTATKPQSAPQQAQEYSPVVSLDYEEGKFGSSLKRAETYCADVYQRQAVAVAMDKENKVATFACDAPL
jgi:hypothetical protein